MVEITFRGSFIRRLNAIGKYAGTERMCHVQRQNGAMRTSLRVIIPEIDVHGMLRHTASEIVEIRSTVLKQIHLVRNI